MFTLRGSTNSACWYALSRATSTRALVTVLTMPSRTFLAQDRLRDCAVRTYTVQVLFRSVKFDTYLFRLIMDAFTSRLC